MANKFRGMEDPEGNIYEIETDDSLEESGIPADAAAVGRRLKQYVPMNQGAENVGKIFIVGTDGNVTLIDMPAGGASGDVTGVLDDSNNILLTGELATGTYTLKYKHEDGTYTDLGNLVVGELPETEPEPERTNFFVIDGDGYLNPGRASSTGADRTDVTKSLLSNYIEVQNGDEIYAYGINSSNENVGLSALYKADKTDGVGFYIRSNPTQLTNVSMSDEVDIFTINYDGAAYIRICCLIPSDLSTIKIYIKRNGEWLTDTTSEPSEPAEPVTVDIALTSGIRIGSDGTDRTQAGYCATPHIDLTDIPKPCVINLTKARWAFTNTADTGMIMYYTTKSDGSKLVGGYTNESVGSGYFTVKINDTLGTDVTVTVTSDEVATIRFSGHWADTDYSDSDAYFEQANTKATLTYTPES